MTPLLVLTRKEAAAALRVSVWVLDHFIASGLLPTIKYPSTKHKQEMSRRVLIRVRDLEDFIQKHRATA